MSSFRRIQLPWTTVAAVSTTPVFFAATDWYEAAGVTAARGWVEVLGRTGQLLVAPGVQLANDIRNPDTGTVIEISGGDASGFADDDGVFDPGSTVTTLSTAGKRVLRAGWVVKLDTGSTLAVGRVGGSIELMF